MNKRAIFPRGKQKSFIKNIKNNQKRSWTELAIKIEVEESTLSKSYYFEKCSLPYEIFKKLISLTNDDEKNILDKYKIEIKDEKQIIGRKGIGEQRKKFSSIIIEFNKENLTLDNSIIKFSLSDLDKKIKIPSVITEDLAEETGMHLGDGFLSAKRYDYRLKGNANDEKEYYINYIAPLFKSLYNIDIKLKNFSDCFGFEITSKALWEFKTKSLGVMAGEKSKISVPERLKVKDIKILCGLIRGLFDTDGCVSFQSRYGYDKYYPVISINLLSKNLIRDIGEILKMLGFNPCIYLDSEYGKICLYGLGSLMRYEKMIGWSSQKNLNKVLEWKNRRKSLIWRM